MSHCLTLFQGRPSDAKVEHTALKYGEAKAVDYIPGAEALDENEQEKEGELTSTSK